MFAWTSGHSFQLKTDEDEHIAEDLQDSAEKGGLVNVCNLANTGNLRLFVHSLVINVHDSGGWVPHRLFLSENNECTLIFNQYYT